MSPSDTQKLSYQNTQGASETVWSCDAAKGYKKILQIRN